MRITPHAITRLVAAALAVSFVSCSLDKQSTPALTGPSELSLSLSVSVTPDIITQDGYSQATVAVTARDAASQPVSGVTLRLETMVGNTPVDHGVLGSKVISTGSDGRATTTYRAPAPPPPTQASDTLVTIVVTPVGSDYAGTVSRRVDLRLARPGIIAPPTQGPTASFFFSPTAPKEDDDVFFDASASTGSIVSYSWAFGDGRSSSAAEPTARHHYGVLGTYRVVLTVTDHLGRSASTAPVDVNVTLSEVPVADIVVSPTDPAPGDRVFFTADLSTAEPSRQIVFYEWNFGDGSPLESGPDKRQTSHVYPTEHTYAVTLKVRDNLGREHVVSTTVVVE